MKMIPVQPTGHFFIRKKEPNSKNPARAKFPPAQYPSTFRPYLSINLPPITGPKKAGMAQEVHMIPVHNPREALCSFGIRWETPELGRPNIAPANNPSITEKTITSALLEARGQETMIKIIAAMEVKAWMRIG